MVYAAAMTHVFAILYGMVQLAVWQTAPVSIPVQRRAIAFYLTLASVILDMTGQRDGNMKA